MCVIDARRDGLLPYKKDWICALLLLLLGVGEEFSFGVVQARIIY
jgi:hypothetical protein